MRKHQLECDVAGARSCHTGVGDREQTGEPRAVVARRRERWPCEGFGIAYLQGGKLSGCFKPESGKGVCRDDKRRFGAIWHSNDANPQTNIAAGQDQMLSVTIVKSCKGFGERWKQRSEVFGDAFNQNGGGEAVGRPVRRGCGGW